ncbi:hypothetical protein EOPP23_13460 [Endozoicomonas sp. OPT23]|uniref:hypothetical protein n=1 Tax=Endozoicomonas sp. OPT23 TaxID=2072845 RepID=UPI00129BFD5F|nr:hypothetical protein [Endozoicomonas sp. OPT23]MRI33998.1 hypothetical protein [Endozoicomonas sp. OPT23]
MTTEQLKDNGGGLSFVERELRDPGGTEHLLQSVVYSAPHRSDLDSAGLDSSSFDSPIQATESALITELIMQLVNVPRFQQSQNDFDFLWRFLASIPAGQQAELFLRVPAFNYQPALLFQGNWMLLTALSSTGKLWFPGTGVHDELFTQQKVILPLDTQVIEYLSYALAALQSKNYLASCGQPCTYDLQYAFTQSDISSRALPTVNASHFIPLGTGNQMPAMTIPNNGSQLELISLNRQLEQLDIPSIYYLPCPECQNWFNQALYRNSAQPLNFVRLMGLFSQLPGAAEFHQDNVQQMQVAGHPPGDGPDTPPLGSHTSTSEPVFIQFGGHKGRNTASKPAQSSQASGKRFQWPAPFKSHKKAKDEASSGAGGQGKNPDDDDPLDSHEQRTERRQIREKMNREANKILKGLNQLKNDLKKEKDRFVAMIKRDKTPHKNAKTLPTGAEYNRKRLASWEVVSRSDAEDLSEVRPVLDLEDHEIYSDELEKSDHPETFYYDKKSDKIIAPGARRVSIPIILPVRAEHQAPVEVNDVAYHHDLGKMMMTGERRASELAHEHVASLRDSVAQQKSLWQKSITKMTRRELSAARERVNLMLSEQLTLRDDELHRLDQGRVRLFHELQQRQEELNKLHKSWFGDNLTRKTELQNAMANVQTEARGIDEQYIHYYGYEQRYRHWSVMMLKENFYSEASERGQELDQANRAFVQTSRIALIGTHWHRKAAGIKTQPLVHLPPPAAEETDAPVNTFFSGKRPLWYGTGTVGLVATGSAVSYYWQELVQFFQGTETTTEPEQESPDSESDSEKAGTLH